jgi:hypothetical protein
MPRSGDLHVTKECSEYKGLAGDFCTITSSNLEEIEGRLEGHLRGRGCGWLVGH